MQIIECELGKGRINAFTGGQIACNRHSHSANSAAPRSWFKTSIYYITSQPCPAILRRLRDPFSNFDYDFSDFWFFTSFELFSQFQKGLNRVQTDRGFYYLLLLLVKCKFYVNGTMRTSEKLCGESKSASRFITFLFSRCQQKQNGLVRIYKSKIFQKVAFGRRIFMAKNRRVRLKSGHL